MENLNLFYQDVGPSSLAGRHLTQEEAAKEELAIKISQRYTLLEEKRHVIETMTYNEKYKKILDEIWKDKLELDGKTVKEDEEAVKRIKGETLKEKDDPGAFIFPIKLEGKVNENALVDTGSDINIMPYRIFETLGREDMKKIDRGITMIDHTQAEAMGKLSNVLCQVGVTTIIAKFLILDIPIDRDAPIVVGRGFLHTIGSILNTSERIFSTFDRICHQTFRAARFDVLRTAESDSDDEEEYVIKRNKFGAPIYGPKPAPYLNCTNPEDQSSAIQTTMGTHDDEARSSRSKRLRHETVEEVLLPQVHHEFLLWVREAESKEETLLEFARRLGLYQAVELEEDGFNVYFEGGFRNDDNFNAQDYWLSINREENLSLSMSHTSTIRNPILRVIHKMITYGLCQRTTGLGDCEMDEEERSWDLERESNLLWDLETTTLRDLIDSDGKLIPEDPQPSVPRVGIPRPPRASMQDLYDRMGRMEIRQDAIERMDYRHSYHWEGIMECLSIWLGFIVFHCREPTTHLAMLSRSMTSTISSTHLRHHRSSSRMMTSSVEMTRLSRVKEWAIADISSVVTDVYL
ncbi:pescadillo [Tanacetum coccineum]